MTDGLASPFLLRAAALYVPLATLVAVWLWRRPGHRLRTGALLATLWNIPTLLGLQVLASYFGWWRFAPGGGTVLGLPVDVYLGWLILWGPLPAIALRRLPLLWLGALALGLDLLYMPRGLPLLMLGDTWLVGETLGTLICLVPAQLLARWTAEDRRLGARVVLQVIGFSGLLIGVVPIVALHQSGGDWRPFFARPVWQLSLIVQVLALPAIVGLSAVQEFALRGGGTPLPFDPPRRLVTSGPYAYIANPMQAAACLVLVVLAVILGSGWLAAAALLDVLYGAGLAGWHEHARMRGQFGADWLAYRRRVRVWWPRWRPFQHGGHEPDVLYVDTSCGPCAQLGRWFERQQSRGLVIVPAAHHPLRDLDRLTFRSATDGHEEEGVAALARALESIHLGWAFVGWSLRLPIIRPIVQLLGDASGGGPHRVSRARPAQ
jgi:protein-S-isoprenylcysteine O-methyltransferase Ste14